ncbi:GNAT family protein [Streptomyces sp. NPDC049577]|uniref:GNAT family N-acetyltransferase n=1 Tax=Streptomyces sp. NPDC049577 TaxID=3155153 RepID=UPI00342C4E24
MNPVARTTLPATELTGLGLRLRLWREADAGAVVRAMNDRVFRDWNHLPGAELMDEAAALDYIRARAERWARGDQAAYCVTDGAGGAVLGQVALQQIEPRMGHANVGYWLLPEARGRGVATRAVELLTRWAFTDLGLHRLDLGHAVGNDASCRVAERCGFAYEGLMRGFLPGPGGTYLDTHLHARLATDPAPAVSTAP